MRAKLQLKDKQLISEYMKMHEGADQETIEKIILKDKGKFRYQKHHPDRLLEAEQYRDFIFSLLDEKLK